MVPTCEKTSFNHFLWSLFPWPYYTVTCYKFMVDLWVQLPCTVHLCFDFCGCSLCNTLKTFLIKFQFNHKPFSAIPCNGIIACSSHLASNCNFNQRHRKLKVKIGKLLLPKKMRRFKNLSFLKFSTLSFEKFCSKQSQSGSMDG